MSVQMPRSSLTLLKDEEVDSKVIQRSPCTSTTCPGTVTVPTWTSNHHYIGLKIYVCLPFWPEKLGGSVHQSFFFFFNLDTEKCSIIYECVFLGIQRHKIGLILVLEVVVFHYIGLKSLLGTVTLHILSFCLLIFV